MLNRFCLQLSSRHLISYSLQNLQIHFHSRCDVTNWSTAGPVPRSELLKNISGVSGLFCSLVDKIDKEVLDKAGPQLKVISTISVGYEHIDIEECKRRKIRIGYTPDVLTDATAELTVALVLATNRRLFEANKQVYNGGWKSWAPSWMCGNGIKESTIGVYGFGRIGKEVANRIKPFKPARLIYSSRTKKANDIGAEFVGFEELVKESDILIVCCALTADTKELFNKTVFKKMKTNSIFINTARGGVVNQKDLYEALKNKTIQSAGLDVTTPEPLPLDDPLLTLDNIVILPHIGSADIHTRAEMSRITACNILSALNGDEMVAEVK